MMTVLRIIQAISAKRGVRLRFSTDGIEEPGAKTVIFDPAQEPLLHSAIENHNEIAFDQGRPVVQVEGVAMYLEAVVFKNVFTTTPSPLTPTWTVWSGEGPVETPQWFGLQDTEMWMLLAWE